MTTKSKAPVQIKVTSHSAAVKFFGHTAFEGFPALVIITIIMLVKLTAFLTRVTIDLLMWIIPIVFRFTLHYSTGLWLAFRAFYTY